MAEIERDELIETYYKSIELLTKEEDIKWALPSNEYNSFYSIMDGLIKRIENEI